MNKIKNGTKGFTLLELLVVVLIIGILAAIALPQYNVAVVKARVSRILPLAKNLLEAQEIYYITNGVYAYSLSSLTVSIASECSHINYSGYDYSRTGELLKCKNDFLLDNAPGSNRISFNYCPGKNTNWNDCSKARHFLIAFVGPDGTEDNGKRKNKQICQPKNNSSLGKKICSSFGTLEEWE